MQKVININKPLGVTPLHLVKEFQSKNPKLKNKKIAYAGRLDPMAEGVMLLLIKPETRNREKYQRLDKTYEFEILFGVSTDTYDILGIVGNNYIKRTKTVFEHTLQGQSFKDQLEKELAKLIGKHEQPYPPYSSARVDGKPLFWWARNGKLNEIKVPNKLIEIYDTKLLGLRLINSKQAKTEILDRIKLVKGDFRQMRIIESWKKFFAICKNNFLIAKVRIDCSSGTYVRSISREIGKKLGTGAIAYSIRRTKVGKFSIGNSLKL